MGNGLYWSDLRRGWKGQCFPIINKEDTKDNMSVLKLILKKNNDGSNLMLKIGHLSDNMKMIRCFIPDCAFC